MDVRIIRDETGETLQSYSGWFKGIVAGTFIGTPAAGTATYHIQIRQNSADSNGGAFCLNRTLVSQVMKR